MADSAHSTRIPQIDRRTAIAGMGATLVGLGTAESAVAAAKATGAVSVADQLNELAANFLDAAKLIDPTIKGGWIGRYVDDEQLPFSISLERESNPLIDRRTSDG